MDTKISEMAWPCVWSAIGGAVVWWAVLSFGFGWTSASTAAKNADAKVEAAVVGALAPVCAGKFLAQSDATAKKAALAKVDSWRRRDELPKEWTTLPGGSHQNPALVDACSALILRPEAAASK